MTFRRLSHLVAAAPLVVAGLGFSLDYLDPRSPIWEARGLLALPVGFLALHIFGMWFYLPFAFLVALLVRRLGPGAHRRFTCFSPVVFACWVLLCLFAFSWLRYPQPFVWRDVADILRISGYAILVGYVYVALLLIVWRLLPRRLRTVEHAV